MNPRADVVARNAAGQRRVVKQTRRASGASGCNRREGVSCRRMGAAPGIRCPRDPESRLQRLRRLSTNGHAHALRGRVAIAFFVSRCFQALRREIVRSSRIVILELVPVGSLTTSAAVIWEFAEFTCDQLFGSNIQRGLGNTMRDMGLGVAGAVAVMVLRARALKARPAELRAVATEWMSGRAA